MRHVEEPAGLLFPKCVYFSCLLFSYSQVGMVTNPFVNS